MKRIYPNKDCINSNCELFLEENLALVILYIEPFFPFFTRFLWFFIFYEIFFPFFYPKCANWKNLYIIWLKILNNFRLKSFLLKRSFQYIDCIVSTSPATGCDLLFLVLNFQISDNCLINIVEISFVRQI